MTCSSFSILEFFLYFVGIDVHSIVPRSDAFTADALIGGSIFSRSYSFSVEPSIFAFFLISLGSIAAYHFYITKRFIPLIIIVFSFFTTFSSSTIGALIISFFIVLFLYFSLKFLFSFNSYTLRKSVLWSNYNLLSIYFCYTIPSTSIKSSLFNHFPEAYFLPILTKVVVV